jgi:hypothetical protein
VTNDARVVDPRQIDADHPLPILDRILRRGSLPPADTGVVAGEVVDKPRKKQGAPRKDDRPIF